MVKGWRRTLTACGPCAVPTLSSTAWNAQICRRNRINAPHTKPTAGSRGAFVSQGHAPWGEALFERVALAKLQIQTAIRGVASEREVAGLLTGSSTGPTVADGDDLAVSLDGDPVGGVVSFRRESGQHFASVAEGRVGAGRCPCNG